MNVHRCVFACDSTLLVLAGCGGGGSETGGGNGTGTIGGTSWNAASVTPVGQLPGVVLSGVNLTLVQFLITPFLGLAEGVFSLLAGTTVRVNQVGSANG